MPAAVAAPVLWSAGNLLVRGAPVDPSQLAIWRMVFGVLLYQVIWRWRGGSMSWETLRLAAPGGVGFGLQAVLFYTALRTTSVVSAVVITSLQPLILIPITRRVFGDVTGPRRAGLTLLAVVGTAIVVVGSSGGGSWSIRGDLLALAATFAGCLYFIGTKSARHHLATLEYQAAALVSAVIWAMPVAALLSGGMSRPARGELVWPVAMALIAGSGHLLMNAAQRFVTVGTTSTLALSVTPLTALGAVVVFGETITWVQVTGMVVVLASLAVFASTAPTALPPSAEESVAQ